MSAAWPKVKLGEVLHRADRFEPKNELDEYQFAGTYSYARGVFVGERKPGATFSLPKIQRIFEGDFVYCKIMAWEGAFGIVPREAHNCVLSGAFAAYEIDRQRLEPKFIDYFFKVSEHWRFIGSQSTGTNVRRQSLHPEQFEQCVIPIPPLVEQQRIVARIEALARQIREAQELRQEAIEQADALRGVSAKAGFNGNWPRARLEDVCEIITDGTHQTPQYVEADGYTFLSAQNVKPFRFMPETHRKVSYEDYIGCQKRVKPQKGDVLLTRVGAGIGEAAVIDRDIDFAFYVSLALIRPSPEKLVPELLTHWLNSPEGIGESRGKTLGKGHSQGNLNLKLLRGFDIPLPPLPEQRRIVAELDTLQVQVATLKRAQAETAAELDALIPAILDKAFRGEL